MYFCIVRILIIAETIQKSKEFEKQCTGYSSQDERLYDQHTNKDELNKKRVRKKNPKYEESDNDLSTESEGIPTI